MHLRSLAAGAVPSLIFCCLACVAAPPAETASRLPPVTVAAERDPLSKVLARVQEQTGIRIEDRAGDPPVTVRLDKLPFWQALDRIAEAAGASVTVLPREGRIQLIPRKKDAPPPQLSYSGPFRLALKRLGTSLDLDTGTHTCTGQIEVAWEPPLLPLFLETRLQGLEVRDAREQVLPFPSGGKSQASVDGRIGLTIEDPLPVLPRTEKTLGRIQGHLTAVVPTKMLTLRFGDLDGLKNTPAVVQQDGVECRVGKVKITSDRWSVPVTINYPPGGTRLDSSEFWWVNNSLTLVSADGKRWTCSPSQTYLEVNAGSRAVINYHFPLKECPGKAEPGAWKITYTTPAALVQVHIPFAFKDVPLP
jgi:hypothetical protein